MKYDKTNLHIYKMDDCEWWLSHLSIEETRELFIKEYGLNENECPIDEIYEEDIDIYYRYKKIDDKNVIKELMSTTINFDKNFNTNKFKLNNKVYRCINGNWYEAQFINRILEIDGEYTEPYLVACIEY